MEAIHYLTNANGVKTSVVIPMQRLLQLSEVIDELKRLEEIANSIRNGIREANLIESGKKDGMSAEDFLNEL